MSIWLWNSVVRSVECDECSGVVYECAWIRLSSCFAMWNPHLARAHWRRASPTLQLSAALWLIVSCLCLCVCARARLPMEMLLAGRVVLEGV